MQKKYLAIAAVVIVSAGLTLTAQLSPNPHTIYTRRLPELTRRNPAEKPQRSPVRYPRRAVGDLLGR